MKTSVAWMGALLFAGLGAASATADYPPCPPQPACPPGCTPMPCPSSCGDPCACPEPCKHSWNPFSWFHHGSKVKNEIVMDPGQGCFSGMNGPGFPGAGFAGMNGAGYPGAGAGAINSPVFPVHPFARSPRDYFMVDP